MMAGLHSAFLIIFCCHLVAAQQDQSPLADQQGQPPLVSAIVVTRSGLIPPQPTHTLITLYLEVENIGSEILDEIISQDAHCCLYQPLPDTTNNCIRVRLLGDSVFNVAAGSRRILFLLYPTIYVFERQGECKVTVEFRSENQKPAQIQHLIHFLTPSIAHFWMPASLKVWFLGYEDCDSVDHDPQRACGPVDCALKYAGQRNYYNASSKRCEPLTLCMTDDAQTMPNVAFRRRWNSCQNIDVNLTVYDRRQLAGDMRHEPHLHHDPAIIYQYVCIHGESRADRSGCVCDPGWVTSGQDYLLTDPDSDMIHMCDMSSLPAMVDIHSRPTQILLVVIGSLCGGLLTLVAALTFFTWWKTQPPSDDLDPADLHMDDLEKRPLYPATISMGHVTGETSRTSLHRISPTSLSSLKESWRYESGRVHTPNMPLTDSELDLRVGDVITHLEETSVPGMWKGRCNGHRGTFPVCCAELHHHGYGPKITD